MPTRWLSFISPVFERLTWPERWGLLIALGLAASAARAPRPKLLAALLIIETLLLSGNAPLQNMDLSPMAGWKRLEATDGAVLELPMARSHREAPFVGLHARIHGKKVVNPILQPPGSVTPAAWTEWTEKQPLMDLLEPLAEGKSVQPSPEIAQRLREDGVGAIALDAGPGAGLTEARLRRWTKGLSALFGDPEDQGSVLIWWLKAPLSEQVPTLQFKGRTLLDGGQWRKAWRIEGEKNPAPELDTLIETLWSH